MRSRKAEDFSLLIFKNQFELVQKRRDNIITTKEKRIGFFQQFFLRNKEFIVYKR